MPKYLLFVTILILSVLSQPARAYTILVWGDSLSAGYGVPADQNWVSLLQERVRDRGIGVVNRSISGETTYGGVKRISQGLVEVNPDLVILELGANDALRGKDTSLMRQNLETMIQSSQDAGADVLLLGMKIPPNFGRTYANAFHQTYIELAQQHDTDIVPFMLEPIALDFDMFQPDGSHPVAAAQPVILDHIWEVLGPMLPD